MPEPPETKPEPTLKPQKFRGTVLGPRMMLRTWWAFLIPVLLIVLIHFLKLPHPPSGFGFFAFCLFPSAVYSVRYRLAVRRLEAVDFQLCTRCMYDLRGLPRLGNCPECNRPYDTARMRELWDGEPF